MLRLGIVLNFGYVLDSLFDFAVLSVLQFYPLASHMHHIVCNSDEISLVDFKYFVTMH
jgi:hypothetical protein